MTLSTTLVNMADTKMIKAFRDLWGIWKENHDIKDDPNEWQHLVDSVRNVVERSKDAEDPEFIFSFGTEVLLSLERISKRER